jgi:sulfur-carrier protein
MRVVIDLCGRLADAAGPELSLPLTAPSTVAAVRDALSAAYPALAAAFAAMPVRAALDEVLVDDDAKIAPGQRLALFPPVSGG